MKRNYLDLTAICSGFLTDQIKAKILTPEKMYLAVDKNKVDRAKGRVMKQSQVIGETRDQEEVISDHWNFCRRFFTCEPVGRYLFHYTQEPATRRSKAAKHAAVGLHEWMVQHGVDEPVLVIGGDSTNSSTGGRVECLST